MKKLNVIVRDKNTIVLEENGEKGDYIDLTSLSNIDLSMLEKLIEEGKDKVYEEKIKKETNLLFAQNETKITSITKEKDEEINNLKKEIEILKSSFKNDLAIQKSDLSKDYELKINKLENDITSLNKTRDSEIEKEKAIIKAEYDKKVSNLKIEREKLVGQVNSNVSNTENKLNELRLKLTETHNEEITKLKEQILQKDNKISELQRQKSILNVKQTGEDLESWCDNEVKSYMQNGLFNCSWIKDNKTVKEDEETKGSKADYIFKIYADEHKIEDQLIISICLEMKDENPDSKNHKKNADYYAQLDKNRKKKECKYALLVSNLEIDKPNDLPIYKVSDYEDMYVVRPGYMMTFINIIASLSKRYAQLVLTRSEEALEIIKQTDFIAEFDKLKNTYLDKPLESLEKQVTEILDFNDAIMKNSEKIKGKCNDIINKYIEEIKKKINKFDEGMKKNYRKLEK